MKKKLLTLINYPRQIFPYLHFDLHDYRKTIFLAGSARSGTTWLQEIINFNNEYRVMFEPFHPKKVELISDWKYFQYLRVDETSSLFLKPMKDILSGNIKNNEIDRFNKRLFSQRRIIKAIHANLFLFWMNNHFPEIPIILILRHPCAVANSKINIAESFFRKTINPLDRFLNQNELIEDFLRPYELQIKNTKTVFETYIFMWCIEYFIPLTQFHKGEIYITFYENICLNAQSEIKNIFLFIKKNYSSDVINKVSIPSPMSRPNSAIYSGTDLIKSWRKNITNNQIQRAIEILNLFGLDMIYNDSDLPLLEGNEILRKFEGIFNLAQ